MRTSLTEIRHTERFLFGQLNFPEKVEFEARVAAHPELQRSVWFQRKLYFLLRVYHRKKQKAALAALHTKLFPV